MTQSLACLGVLVAVLAAAWRWDLPARPEPSPASPAVAPRKTKPRVKIRIQMRSRTPDRDNSDSACGVLGFRTSFVPGFAPSWMHRAGWQLERAGRAILTLKPRVRKSILGPVS